LKEELQEVPKGGNWPKRHFSFPGDLRDIYTLWQYTKGLYKPNLQLDPWNHQFPGPCACPHAVFLFSSLQIKSAAGVRLCFHSQSGPKNPEHLKISVCHLCINTYNKHLRQKAIARYIKQYLRDLFLDKMEHTHFSLLPTK
jgi:hypothetical protein